MNWEAIGAIGELVGAVGVIATIAFLAFQIRQNSNLLKNNTRQLEQNHEVAISDAYAKSIGASGPMLAVAQSNDLSNILHHGLANYQELDRESAMRFSLAMGPILAGISTSFMMQRQLGINEDNHVPSQLNFAMRFIDTVGGRQWWVQGKGMLPDAFIEIVDIELARRDGKEPDANEL